MTDDAKAECEVALFKMRLCSKHFYHLAIGVGVHQFVEFAGFINEYINMCEAMMEKGKDFREWAPEMDDHNLDYVFEKFGCIFGPAFTKNPSLAARFAYKLGHDL